MNLDGTLNWDNILNEHPTMSDEKFESFIKTCTDELCKYIINWVILTYTLIH